MVALIWLRGLLARRRARLLATAAGVAIAVSLLASLGAFLSSTNAKMTTRAATPDPGRLAGSGQLPARGRAQVIAKVRTQPGVIRALPVRFASTGGLSATTSGSTQTTGPGKVVGLPPATPRPSRARCACSPGAVTAPCSPSRPRPTFTPSQATSSGSDWAGSKPAVRIAGVVDLPPADSLFQKVGAPVGAQPQAPPDNVVLLPLGVFDAAIRGVPVTTQVHAKLSHRLPGSPSAAYTQVSGGARNLETRLAGAGLVGDNLGSALDQARSDALYAQLLFLFLGVPGAILAALVTASVASAGADRRRRELALLRTRGASTRRLTGVALAETALAGGVGVAVGLAAAVAIGSAAFGTASFGAGTAVGRSGAAEPCWPGLATAAGAIALPARRDARRLTVAGQRRQLARRGAVAPVGPLRARLRRAGRRRDRLLAGFPQRLPARARARGRASGLGQLVRAAGAGARAGSAPACSPTESPSSLLGRGRAAVGDGAATARGRAVLDRRCDDEPPAPAAGTRRRAARAHRGLRRIHRRLQLDLSAAGRGGRAPDERRRRDRHGVPRRRRRPRRDRTSSRRSRACTASSRSSTDLPTWAPTSRISTGCDPATIGAAGKLQDAWFAGRQCAGS